VFFEVHDMPDNKVLAPGEAWSLPVAFTPQLTLAVVVEQVSVLVGLVVVYATDQGHPGQEVTAPVLGSEGSASCNLIGQGILVPAAEPAAVDFGQVTVGGIGTRPVTAQGPLPAGLCSVQLDGCGPEFEVTSVAVWSECVVGEQAIELAFQPAYPGSVRCVLRVSTDWDGGYVDVPITGLGVR
jgi:hypothetical protein